MRAGGYEVRVLPVEGGSYEEMPPTLPDFIKRDLRWCQGNMQYLQLLVSRGSPAWAGPTSRSPILMYTGAPAWLLFMVLGMSQAVVGPIGPQAELGGLMGQPGPEVAIALFVTMMGITFAPKLIGYTHALLDPARRRAYGGALHVIGGGLAELLFSMLIAPVVMLAQSVFVAGLFLGRKVKWEAQVRDGHRVPWSDAARGMWPQTLFGLVAGGLLAVFAPAVLPWAAPVLIGLLLAVPMTVATSAPAGPQAGAAGRLRDPGGAPARRAGAHPYAATAPTPAPASPASRSAPPGRGGLRGRSGRSVPLAAWASGAGCVLTVLLAAIVPRGRGRRAASAARTRRPARSSSAAITCAPETGRPIGRGDLPARLSGQRRAACSKTWPGPGGAGAGYLLIAPHGRGGTWNHVGSPAATTATRSPSWPRSAAMPCGASTSRASRCWSPASRRARSMVWDVACYRAAITPRSRRSRARSGSRCRKTARPRGSRSPTSTGGATRWCRWKAGRSATAGGRATRCARSAWSSGTTAARPRPDRGRRRRR